MRTELDPRRSRLAPGEPVVVDAPAAATRAAPASGAVRAAGPGRGAAAVSSLLDLQRSAGNASVGRLVARLEQSPDVATGAFVGSRSRPMLKPGDPGAAELQEKLAAAGATPAPDPTGTYDAPTRRAVVAFQRSHGLNADALVGPLTWGALDRVTGTPGLAVGPDQHAGTHLPTKDEQDKVQPLLHPEGGKDDTAWDGKGKGAQAAQNRAALEAEMQPSLTAALAAVMPDVRKWAAAPRMPIADMQPTGREAKRLADEQFRPLVAAAARTASQEAGVAGFDFTAGVNLFDAADKAARPPSAVAAAAFLAFTDKDSKAHLAAHHLQKDRSTEEEDFFFDHIAAPFAGVHKEELETYDQFGFSSAKPGKVMAQTTLDDPKFPNTPTTPGAPTPAARHLKWKMLRTLVHEYIHVLEHPAFTRARGSNDVMREGFCEMFTKEVMIPAVTAAQGGDAKIRIGVEGGDFPGFTPDMVPDYKPAGQYAGFLANAEGIRDAVGPANVHAAFFQGHVELMGLTPKGTRAAPATGDQDVVRVPSSVHTPFALAVLTGAGQEDILAANPTLPPNGPLPAKVKVPGCRYHRVVQAVQRDPASDAVVDRQGESKEQIATQNGVTVADLERANPGHRRRTPVADEELLVPVRG
jgi:hypothetical protein